MSDVERLIQQRRRFLWIGLLTSALWCGALTLSMTPWFAADTQHLLSILTEVFLLPWGVFLIWFVIWERRVKAQPAVFAVINDEMMVRNRLRAQSASRMVMTVSLMLGLVITSFVKINAPPVLVALIWISTVSQVGFVLWYDREA